MPMTIDEIDTDINFPEQAEKILDILRSNGDWMSRTDIAKVLDKKILNPADLAYLEVMSLNGIVEIGKEDVRTPTGFQWVYRAIV